MLTVTDLHQHYGSSHTLRSLSLEAKPGQVLAVLGRNGVGKTTLLRTLMGLVPPTSGSILWEGVNLSRRTPEERVRAGFGYVPQGREIFPRLTVEENLLMGMATLPSRQSKVVPQELYDLFPVLFDMKTRRGGDLSGGQQQQLAIARALAGKPKLLLLDEPTEGIQPSIIKLIGEAIKSLAARGDMAIVLVEQYFDFAAALADRYLVLSRGEVVSAGGKQELADPQVRSLLSV